MGGAVGGLAAAVLGGGVAAHVLYLRSLPLLDGVVLSIVAGALGQADDPGESLLKRSPPGKLQVESSQATAASSTASTRRW